MLSLHIQLRICLTLISIKTCVPDISIKCQLLGADAEILERGAKFL